MRLFVRQSMVAAAYAAASIAIAPLSFGMVQVRFSEILMLLVLADRRYSMALIAGCFITNLFSPLGMIDAVFGTAATALCCVALTRYPHPRAALLFLPLINGAIVGAELTYLWELPFFLSMLSVAAGEFAALLVGVILYQKFERRLKQLLRF